MSAPTTPRIRTPRTVLRTLLASFASLTLALGGAAMVLGCSGGTMTGDAGTAKSAAESAAESAATSGAQTAAASMPGMATMPADPEPATAEPATVELATLTGVAEIMSHHHGMTTVQMDELWMARPAYVRDNGSAVSEAYAFALAQPGPLETMPCYCGCVAMDHRSNLDCFFKPRNNEADPLQFEEHASFCGICIDTALLTKHRLAEGATLVQIRAEVDATIGNNGVEGTHTALPPAA